MKHLNRLVREIHERSLWQALVVYLGLSWAILESGALFIQWYGLPTWLFSFALVLLLLGLPVVVVASLGAEEKYGEEVPAGQEAVAAAEDRRLRRLTWRTAGQAFVAALAIWGVVLSGWLLAGGGKGAEEGESVTLLEPEAMVVLPARVAGADPALAFLREGLLDFLYARFTGEGGPRAADPRFVMSAWRRTVATEGEDLPADSAMSFARRLGAGWLVLGAAVGTADQVELSAQLYDVRTGEEVVQASVGGPVADLGALADRLTAQLLAGGAGEPDARQTALTGVPLQALKAYLEGQAAFRRGRWREAGDQFERALELDSTFALATLELVRARMPEASNRFQEALAQLRARAGPLRDRLNHRDQIILDGFLQNDLDGWRRAVEVAPDDALAWVEMADKLFLWGPGYGIEDAHEQARRGFRRALALDSTSASAARKLAELAALAGDTAEVRRMGALYFRNISADAEGTDFMRWRIAVALGDSAALADFRSRFDEVATESLFRIIGTAQQDGIALEDADRAAELYWLRVEAGEADIGWAREALLSLARNRGRPAEAEGILVQLFESDPYASDFSRYAARVHRIQHAMVWEGDTAAAAVAYRQLEPRLGERPEDETELGTWLGDLLLLEGWKLLHGDTSTTARSIEESRDAGDWWIASYLQQMLAVIENRPVSKEAVDSLDAEARKPGWVFENLGIARMREAQGDLEGALAAVRRRPYSFTYVFYLSTALREEGRLAALVGDREGAIRAYRHYLALRSDPEPGLRPEVERVRGELARLVGEGGGT